MTDPQTKIMKLSSGEEIICDLVGDENPRVFNVRMPMKVMSVPRATSDGIEEQLSLTRWIHFTDVDTFDVPKTQVLAMATASIGMKRFYDYCLNKLEHNLDIQEPSHDDLEAIEDEEWTEELEDWEPDSKLVH